jgi:hypothetical protein
MQQKDCLLPKTQNLVVRNVTIYRDLNKTNETCAAQDIKGGSNTTIMHHTCFGMQLLKLLSSVLFVCVSGALAAAMNGTQPRELVSRQASSRLVFAHFMVYIPLLIWSTF